MIALENDVICPKCQGKMWVKSCGYAHGQVLFVVWCGPVANHLYFCMYPLHNVVFFTNVVTQSTFDREFTLGGG